MRSLSLLVPALTAAIVIGCSGAASSDLFGAPSSSSPSSAGDAGGSGNHATDAGHGSNEDASTGGGSAGPDSGAIVDSALPVEDSATPVIDAAPPPENDKGTQCGGPNGNTTYCGSGESCCITGNGPNATYKCNQQFVSFCNGVQVDCDDEADCTNGQVCCGTMVNNRYQSVRCMPSCDSSGGAPSYRFCNPHAKVDECASDGLSCIPSQSLPGYYVCN